MDGRFISQTELAQRWQLSESTLERWRAEGIGPLFLKLQGQVRYRDIDIWAYENQALHASTRYSAGAAPIGPAVRGGDRRCSGPLQLFLSLGDAQEHRQATFDLHQRIRVDVPEGWSYLDALDRHRLVHHHL